MPDQPPADPAGPSDEPPLGPAAVEALLLQARRKDSRYALDAYRFLLFEGLEFTAREHLKLKERRHMTGSELCEGLRALALREFGFLAAEVWRGWGIRATRDWGEVVFNLVGVGLLNTTPTDRIEDFENIYDVERALSEFDGGGAP